MTCLPLIAKRAHEEHGIDEGDAVRSVSLSHRFVRGWRNTVGNLIEICWLPKAYHHLHVAAICVNSRGLGFI